jgi:hypothetical protein
MKLRSLLLAIAVLFAGVSAYAKLIPLRPFFLDQGITLNGVEVPQGMYSLSLETQGTSVVVTLRRGEKFIASAHGNWVNHDVKYGQTSVLLRVNPDGTRSLAEIRLAGSTKTVMLDNVTDVLHAGPGQSHTTTSGADHTPVGN